MSFDTSFQIRKLPRSHIIQLSRILDLDEQWKKFMALIPERQTSKDTECCITCENPAAYNNSHIRLLETAALKYKKSKTETLLDEWGCSGRILPTVGHLLQVLLAAELYRAADYVSMNILGRNSVIRPTLGPAARICVDIESFSSADLPDLNVLLASSQMTAANAADMITEIVLSD